MLNFLFSLFFCLDWIPFLFYSSSVPVSISDTRLGEEKSTYLKNTTN